MLKRAHIEGYGSLAAVEVELDPLIGLFEPSASAKSNILDALQLLSRPSSRRTLCDHSTPRTAARRSSRPTWDGRAPRACQHERVHQHPEAEQRFLLLHCLERELTAMVPRFDDIQIDVNDLNHDG